jgi:SAM-dependent methyltransferase
MSQCDNDCSVENPLEQVRLLYTELAQHPEKDFGWGKGKENARHLGYAEEWLDHLPDIVWESAAAVGNPFSLGPVRTGETVVDIGCGAGADACVAALLVGKEGKVFGVDCTPAMVTKATENAAACGLSQTVFQEAEMTKLPLPDCAADVVISNGSINLTEDKHTVLGEVFRVLQPGGRLQIADMVRDPSTEDSACSSGEESWADCVSGTLDPDTFLSMLTKVGFTDVELVRFTGYRTATSTTGALFKAIKPS